MNSIKSPNKTPETLVFPYFFFVLNKLNNLKIIYTYINFKKRQLLSSLLIQLLKDFNTFRHCSPYLNTKKPLKSHLKASKGLRSSYLLFISSKNSSMSLNGASAKALAKALPRCKVNELLVRFSGWILPP